MIAPLSPGQPSFSAPMRSAGPSDSEQDGFRPQVDEELTRNLQARILLAHINAEMQRGSGAIPPPPPEEPTETTRAERGHSTTGMLQDARLDMKAGEMKGPLTPDELWGGYLIPRHNPWR